tara:strand:+ start:228 stop:929 length:702 start_codon:yes stop_codon:yes gene_type:complete
MQNKTLVSFGDSWPQGSELKPSERPFGKLLSEKLGCKDFNNYSIPASSINHLSVQLNSYIKLSNNRVQDLSDTIAVFFLTAQERFMVYEHHTNLWMFQTANTVNGVLESSRLDGGEGEGGGRSPGQDKKLCDDTNQAYWKYIYSPELTDITTNNTIITLQSTCKYYGIKDYYIAGWQLINFWPVVDTTRIYKNGTVNCRDLIKGHIAEGSHPDQQGHQLISDALYEWIQTDAR